MLNNDNKILYYLDRLAKESNFNYDAQKMHQMTTWMYWKILFEDKNLRFC